MTHSDFNKFSKEGVEFIINAMKKHPKISPDIATNYEFHSSRGEAKGWRCGYNSISTPDGLLQALTKECAEFLGCGSRTPKINLHKKFFAGWQEHPVSVFLGEARAAVSRKDGTVREFSDTQIFEALNASVNDNDNN